MIITSVFAAVLTFALLYHRLPTPALLLICVALALFLIVLRKRDHSHDGFIKLDVLAQGSKLKDWNTGLKVVTAVAVLVFCIGVDNLAVSLAVLGVMTVINLTTSKLNLAGYLALLTVPVTFVVLSGIVLLVDISPEPLGYLELPLFGRYLSITAENQLATGNLLIKAIAALSCLYALSLSTPMYEITSFLRRIHVPAIFVELMVLIYRYIFLLLASLSAMTTAANARLGYASYRNTWRSFTGVGANLLTRSFIRASKSFDAMESRCYDGEIIFLERTKPPRARQWVLSAITMAIPLGIFILERWLP